MPLKESSFDGEVKTVIGARRKHIVQDNETLLDIARHYNLGFNEIEALYPQQDPWIPSAGMELIIPSQWILPDTQKEGIIINIPELRLYYFIKNTQMVKTCPIGIGEQEWQTPLGNYPIKEKQIQPVWFIPQLLQEKYGSKIMPPGPDNPLGKYWMGLGESGYGIHGTNIPWSIGRLVTHGCIRLYPEDMEQLFDLAGYGTSVEIIYEPVKIGQLSDRVYIEVHKDIYNRIENFVIYGYNKLIEKGVVKLVNLDKFYKALESRNGLPVDITLNKN
ncbi:MAG: L,D-transpeptidase family protein [bacterium]